MSKHSPKSKPTKKKAKTSESYIPRVTSAQIVLTLLWLVAVIWIVYGSVLLDQRKVIGVLARLVGLWLLQTGLLSIFGLLEILFQRVTGWPQLGSRSITGGQGVKGIIRFCIFTGYIVTLIMAFATAMRYF